jgi:hypothetical protein
MASTVEDPEPGSATAIFREYPTRTTSRLRQVINASFILAAWSAVLMVLFEHRMSKEIAQMEMAQLEKLERLQAEHFEQHRAEYASAASHREHMEEHLTTTRQQVTDMFAEHREQMHGDGAAEGETMNGGTMMVAGQGSPTEALDPTPMIAKSQSGETMNGGTMKVAGQESPTEALDPTPMIAKRKSKERRLPGFMTVGTTGAQVGCFSFQDQIKQMDLSSKDCRATKQLCGGCFIVQ